MDYFCSLHKLTIALAVVITLASQNVAVVVTKTDDNPDPRARCNGDAPKDPAKHRLYAEKVMWRLVETTPLRRTRMYKTWAPERNIGSVTGAATCYTNDHSKCRACLVEVKARLTAGVCRNSTGGACFNTYCNMEFWTVFD